MTEKLIDTLKMTIHEIEKDKKSNDENIKKLKYFKFSDYNNVSDEIEKYLSNLTDEIQECFPENADIQSLNFLLYELLINIYKHSKFKNSYVLCNSKNSKDINITIFDDGIGIPGSLNEASISYLDDNDAIFKSINGTTTDKEKYNLHGRGLNSSARIVTLGFKGEMLIASNNGICTITKSGAKTYSINKTVKGTLIMININNIKVENIYECIKYEKIKRLG